MDGRSFFKDVQLTWWSQSWLRKSEQGDKWSFCLTAVKINPRIRRDDEQTSTPDAHTGI